MDQQYRNAEKHLENKTNELDSYIRCEKIYIPKKDCRLDKQLADYINNYPE